MLNYVERKLLKKHIKTEREHVNNYIGHISQWLTGFYQQHSSVWMFLLDEEALSKFSCVSNFMGKNGQRDEELNRNIVDNMFTDVDHVMSIFITVSNEVLDFIFKNLVSAGGKNP